MSSAFTLDKVLANAKGLVTCLKEQEATVEALLSQTQDLSKKVESMKMVSIMSLLFYTVSRKNIPPSTCNNLYVHGSIATIFGTNVAEKVGSQNVLYFPNSPN